MKRSEMIYKLAGFICDIKMNYTDYTWTDLEKPEAEELLKLIEDAGMLPPYYNLNPDIIEEEECKYIYSMYNEWETENE